MALTEIQLPQKQQFYGDLQSVASEIASRGLRWKELSDFIQRMETTDLDAMGVPAGQVRTDLNNFRVALDALVTAIETNDAVWDALRRALIL